MPSTELHGKVALVTGGARRIGRAICRELAASGASVAFTYRSSGQQAQELAEELEALGARALALSCDVRSAASVEQAVAQTVAALGRIDILVNNAAVFESAELATLDIEAWDRVFETNARGPFLVARAALPHLQAAAGRIVNMGSLGGMRPWATHAHYCASKAALHALTQSMARAFAPRVSVNAVAPGFIDFEEDRGALAGRLAERTPMGRNGRAEEVAAAVRFFATGPAYITGQILAVDGGLGLV
jgi:3-oxoacyl-[acyl-carrier protein] reductase/pteridine reductase